jgi:CHAT domain-containing protein/Tfp pilus assembly protein PilF
MAHENPDDGLIRRYLLGQLAEDELHQVEERMMVGNELFDRVLLAEDEMVEEYVQGELSESDRVKFEASFLSTPEGRQQVTYARALSQYVKDPSPSPDVRVGIGEEQVADERTAQRPSAGGPPAEGPGAEEPATESKASRPAWWRRPELAPYLRLAAAVVVVLSVGLGAWRLFIYQSEVTKGTAALAYAYRDQRPLEARISGFNYAPVATTRGSDQKVDRTARNLAESVLLEAVLKHPNAATHHAAGRLYLAEKKFDEAIEQFEGALKLDPNNAQLHSDYGAALMEQAKFAQSAGEPGQALENRAKALGHFTIAHDLNNALLEALFNRALCYQYLMLPRQAEEDWQEYLRRDPNSNWAVEARAKLRELEEKDNKVTQTQEHLYQEFISAYQARNVNAAWAAFSRGRIRSGNFIVEKLTDDCLATSPEASRHEAKDSVRRLLYAGDLELEMAGDRYTFDLSQFYRRISPRQQAILKEARSLVKGGQIQIAQSSLKSAFETYERAKVAFDQVGDKCESMSAAYWLAICLAEEIDPQSGPAKFHELIQGSEKYDYKWLVIRSWNALANHNLNLNEYSRVIRDSARSCHLAEQIQDTYGLVLALSNLIQAYGSLGNRIQTLDYLQQLVTLAADRSIEPIQSCLCLARTAWTLYSLDLLDASLNYQKAALASALELNELRMICTSYAHLGMIQAKLNNLDDAFASVRRASEIASARSDERPGSLMIAYAELHLGSLYRQRGELPAAIESYNKAVADYTRLDFPPFIHEARKGLVLSYIASGDDSSAEAELGKAIGYYEDHRSKIWDQTNRNTFFDQVNDIYDIAIDFEYSRNKSPQAAFDYSELNRGRTLLDLINHGGQVSDEDNEADPGLVTQPLGLAQIQKQLPQQVQVVQYAVLEDKLLIWFLTNSSFQPLVQPITSRALGDLVQNYSTLVSTPSSDMDDVSRSSRELYRLLIGPVEPFLDRDAQLFIVADKILDNVPFQSLISPATGRYLIKEYPLALSPSSSVLIACTEAAARKGKTTRESALSVGVTHSDHPEYGKLPDLSSAAKEAKNVVANYPSSVSLVNEQARKRDVLREIQKASVIHLASHFISSDSSPLRSRLLLMNEPGRDPVSGVPDGVLESSEIYKARLPAAKLVVLSACQTGIERYYRGEGAISLARAFIAAGAPLVVASLWAVDSDSTTELMMNFHRNRKQVVPSSAEALRRAQLAMLTGADTRYRHPYYWASFNLIGGFAEY